MSKTVEPVYFLDRCLGKSIGKALKALGKQVEFHSDHFRPESPDTEWLPIVSDRGWIVFTKDENIGRNELEVKSVAQNQIKLFVLVAGNIRRDEMVRIFQNAIEKIGKIVQGNQVPFIAKIYKDGRIVIWKNHSQLNKLLKS